MRHVVIVAGIWIGSVLAVSLAGYILASTGPMGEIGRDAAATGQDPVVMARERGIADLFQSMEKTAWRLNAFFFPAVAALFGAIVGLWSRSRTVLLTVIAMAPLLGFILASRSVSIGAIAWSLLYLAIAPVVGVALARNRRDARQIEHAGMSGRGHR